MSRRLLHDGFWPSNAMTSSEERASAESASSKLLYRAERDDATHQCPRPDSASRREGCDRAVRQTGPNRIRIRLVRRQLLQSALKAEPVGQVRQAWSVHGNNQQTGGACSDVTLTSAVKQLSSQVVMERSWDGGRRRGGHVYVWDRRRRC